MFSFFKHFIFYWFIWSLIIIHLNAFVRAYIGRASPRAVKKCPFKLTTKYFNSPTVAIANSIYSDGLKSFIPSLNPMVLSMQKDAQSWTHFHHIHHCTTPRCSPSGTSNSALYSTMENTMGTHYMPLNPTPFAPSYYDPAAYPPPNPVTPTSTPALSTATPTSSAAKKRPTAKLSDLQVVVLGLSHHNAKVDVREKLAIPEQEWNEVASQLVAQFDSISEATVISTCNRFEIYLAGVNQYEVIRDAMKFFLARSERNAQQSEQQQPSQGLDLATLRKFLFMLSGEDAMWHLLRVSSGLDSLVIGEGQILAQVKKAYDHGLEEAAPGGKVVSRLFNIAIASGKRVRTETGISKGAVSVSSAAAEFTALQLRSPGYGSAAPKTLAEADIVLVGAGKMARLLLVHLVSQGVNKVTIVNRSPERMAELQAEFPTLAITMVGMESLWQTLATADVCYPCTASTSTIIDPAPLEAVLASRSAAKPLQLVDISVPRNVHPEVDHLAAKYPNMLHNFNVDHLHTVVQQNTCKRKKEILQAERILRDELEKFMMWQQSLGAIPTIAKLQEKAEAVRQEEVLKAMNKFSSGLSEKDMAVVEKVTKGIVAKLLHGPMNHLRQQKECDATRMAIQQVQQAFQLSN